MSCISTLLYALYYVVMMSYISKLPGETTKIVRSPKIITSCDCVAARAVEPWSLARGWGSYTTWARTYTTCQIHLITWLWLVTFMWWNSFPGLYIYILYIYCWLDHFESFFQCRHRLLTSRNNNQRCRWVCLYGANGFFVYNALLVLKIETCACYVCLFSQSHCITVSSISPKEYWVNSGAKLQLNARIRNAPDLQ